MQDVLLLAAMAAVFTFGWFLMGRLDQFLAESRQEQDLWLLFGGNRLRLGFCDPMVAGGMADVLEQYSRLHPDVTVRIFCGSEKELLKGLSGGKYNVIFLPEGVEFPARAEYDSMVVSLNYTPVMMKYGGLPIEPIADGHITQNALWRKGTASAFTCRFMKYLEKKLPLSARAE